MRSLGESVRRFAQTLWVVALLVGAVAAGSGCSGGGNPGAAPTGKGNPMGGGACGSTPATGCACPKDGESVACGDVAGKSGNYVFCSEGRRACSHGEWSACVGEQLVSKSIPVENLGDIHPENLGTVSSCTSNPCDPYCSNFVNTPSGTTPPPGFALTPDGGGLQLAGSAGASCTALAVTPATQTITVSAVNATTGAVTTTPTSVTFAGNCTGNPASPSWTLSDYDVATISSSGVVTVFADVAETLTVTATLGSLTATATLVVNVNVTDTTAAPSSAIATSLNGTTTSGTEPAVMLYPYNNTVFPLGLAPPLVQWELKGNTVAAGVKVSLDYTPATGATFHWSGMGYESPCGPTSSTTCTSTAANPPLPYNKTTKILPSYTIPQSVWSGFDRSAQGVVASAGTAKITVQRLVGAALHPALTPANVGFATAPLNGTIYYVQYLRNITNAHANDGNVTNVVTPYTIGSACPVGNGTHVETGLGGSGIQAIDPSSAGTPSDPFNNTAGCPVCHSISATGNMFLSVDYGIDNSVSNSTAIVGINKIGAGGVFTAVNNTATSTASGLDYPGETWSGWQSRGFSYSALTPTGTYNLQGTEFWGNTGNEPTTSAAVQSLADNVGTGAYQVYSLPNATNVTSSTTGLGTTLMMTPTFSPDGTKLAFVNGDKGAGFAGTPTGWRKGLSVMSFKESTKTFSTPAIVVNTWNNGATTGTPVRGTGNPIKWPFFEPDSQSLMFVETETAEFCLSSNSANGNNDDANNPLNVGCYQAAYGNMSPTTRSQWNGDIYSVAINTTTNVAASAPVALTNLNKGQGPADADQAYQPSVFPQASGGYRWVIFTSQRPYGNQINPYDYVDSKATTASCATSQIWMAAVDNVTSAASDRSHPAFWVPNQRYAPVISGAASNQYVNERGYIVPQACNPVGSGAASVCDTNTDCCAPAQCRIDLPAAQPPTRHCQTVSGTCAQTGGSCSTSADCCNGASCVAGACTNASSYQTEVYTQDFNAACAPGSDVAWHLFQWNASIPSATPGDAKIVFTAVTAATEAALSTATDTVTIGTANAADSNPPPATYDFDDLATLFSATNNRLPWLRVSMTFSPSSNSLQTPILYDWNQTFDCTPAQ